MEDPNRSELEVELAHVDTSGRPIGSWLCCLPCDWLKRNSSFHKMFLKIATLLVTVLLVASPVLFLISSIPGDKSKDCRFQGDDCEFKGKEKVCLEEQCVMVANRILASMSWKTNPCQDFYHFACGSWKEKSENPEKFSQNLFTNFETLQQNVDRNIQQLLGKDENSDPFQKVGFFYKSCIRAGDKEISLLPMLSVLDDLGGYAKPHEELSTDLTDLLLNLLRLNGAPLFDIYLDLDSNNSSKLAPIIDLPMRFGYNVPFKSMEKTLMNEFVANFIPFYKLKTSTFINKWHNLVKAKIEEKRLIIMERIMQEFMSGNMSFEDRIKETQTTLFFASKITQIYPREKKIIEHYQRETNMKMTLENLQKNYPFVRWQYLLQEFLKIPLNPQDYVFILPPTYLDNLLRILPKFPPRVVHNGLLVLYATDTLYELLNTSLAYDWPAFCAKVTVNVFSKAVSILYVRQYKLEFIERLRLKVSHIFNALKKTVEKRIEKVAWLDEKARKAVYEKLSTLRVQFLTWGEFWNSSYAEALMENVQVNPEDFFGNVILRFKQLREFPANFNQLQFEEKPWAFPFIVNAFYIFTTNTIIIPLAVLTQPYFREDVPLYISYSTVGLVLAHEIFHGFDIKGVGYNSEGQPEPLLTPESRARLEARLDCFVKQFSSIFWKKVTFLGSDVDIEFDWNMTKNENMADISGLQVAYDAWKSISDNEKRLPGVALNAQQLFFLHAAQTYCSIISPTDYIFLVGVDSHTPQPERVNGMMMNSPGFTEAYKCPIGSPMNPRKKCSTW